MRDWFDRIQVGAMNAGLAEALMAGIRTALDYLGPTLAREDQDWVTRVEHARRLLELLSRLAVRATPDEARSLFNFAIQIFDQGADRHWWMYQPVSNLLRRSLSAIPPSERGQVVEAWLNFPLPTERQRGAIEEYWPDLSQDFEANDIGIVRPAGAWSERIAALIGWVRRDRHNGRRHAVLRLRLLHARSLLTKPEQRDFSAALWSQRTSDHGLPDVGRLYPGVLLELPEPKRGMAVAAFDHDIVQPLLRRGPYGQGMYESLAYAGAAAKKGGISWPYSPDIAIKLLRAMPRPQAADAEEEIGWAIAAGLLPLARLEAQDLADLRDRAEDEKGRAALLFLPRLAKDDPAYTAAAVARLRRALGTRDFKLINHALEAIRDWARAGTDGFPQQLASMVAALIAARRDPGLFRVLDVAVTLVRQGHVNEALQLEMIEGLSLLLDETDYRAWRPGDYRTATLTFIRANACRLALALAENGTNDPVVASWLAVGQSDVLPEVRFATDD
jgi:hypothetical protein